MDKILRLPDSDFALTTDALAFMQNAYTYLENLRGLGGDNYIVIGGNESGGVVEAGVIVLNGQIMPFSGGAVQTNVRIITTITDKLVGAAQRRETTYRAEFGTSANPAENVLWADIVKIRTNKELDENKVEKEAGKGIVDPTAVSSTGMLMPWAGLSTNKPDGWLICDGSAVSRTTYAALFAIVGVKYGGGDGVNTFNLPDLGGRIPVGATQNTDILTPNLANGYGVGQKVGEDSHVLTLNEMPNHRHEIETVGYAGISGAGNNYVGKATNPTASNDFTNYTGANQAHENRQPSVAMYYIIKT